MELEDVYQWENTSQNFVSAEPDTLHKADGPTLHSW